MPRGKSEWLKGLRLQSRDLDLLMLLGEIGMLDTLRTLSKINYRIPPISEV